MKTFETPLGDTLEDNFHIFFVERVREHMSLLNMTQKELAEASGIKPAKLNKLLNLESKMSLYDANLIACTLKTTIDGLNDALLHQDRIDASIAEGQKQAWAEYKQEVLDIEAIIWLTLYQNIAKAPTKRDKFHFIGEELIPEDAMILYHQENRFQGRRGKGGFDLDTIRQRITAYKRVRVYYSPYDIDAVKADAQRIANLSQKSVYIGFGRSRTNHLTCISPDIEQTEQERLDAAVKAEIAKRERDFQDEVKRLADEESGKAEARRQNFLKKVEGTRPHKLLNLTGL